MELELQNPNTIELPAWIGRSNLTLPEIGAIAVLACLQNGEKDLEDRMASPEFQKTAKSLSDREVFKASVKKVDGHVRVTLEIDLDVVAPD